MYCFIFTYCVMLITRDTLFKSLQSVKPFLNEINTFIQQGCIKLIKKVVNGKDIYKVIKDF